MNTSAEASVDLVDESLVESAITDAEPSEIIDSVITEDTLDFSHIDPALFYGSSVFDSTSMAPLSPASEVSN